MPDLEDRKLVCRRCHRVMGDREPLAVRGEFLHPENTKKTCKNEGKVFFLKNGEPEDRKETTEFVRKSIRRAERRSKRTTSRTQQL